MKVFVAGATGVLGRRLLPMLARRGHEVVGMTRTESKRELLASLGAEPVVADALDPEAVGRAVSEAEPEVIVHELTAIPASMSFRRMERDFAATNRLRTEGTDHLLSAARAAGVRRFVAQSFASYFARTGGAVKREDDALDPDPPAAIRTTLEAIRHVEEAVTGADWVEGLVLRYGGFYGPGTSFAVKPPGELVELIRKRMLPIVGGGAGVWSFVHIEDAAGATADAVERGAPGIYHVVDDEPAAVREWLPVAAEALGAKRPRRLPRWLGRLAAGRGGGRADDRGARRVQRQGQARARLAAALPELAAGVRRGSGLSMAQSLEELRPRAFAIAYRMLGDVGEAEDVVQEALLRLHRAREAGERVHSPLAYLSTVVTRLAIDELRSARARRERYVGEWLPEPLLTSEDDDPARQAEMADSLSLTFLMVLERLSPEQRAVFLLREVFDYPYEQIAGIVGRSEAAVRQVASRARRHLKERRPRFEPSREHRERLASRFFAAVEEGDLKGLESLLAADVVLNGDGGGKVPALARPVHGRGHVARTLLAWARAAVRLGGVSLRRAEVNGQPGAMALDVDGRLISVIALDILDGRIQAVNSLVNPDKLAHLGLPVAAQDALSSGRVRQVGPPWPFDSSDAS